jgi:hypothetical protein
LKSSGKTRKLQRLPGDIAEKCQHKFSNRLFRGPNVRCKEQNPDFNEREVKEMDYVTSCNVSIRREKRDSGGAGQILYDTLFAALKEKKGKEKKHA